MNILMGWQSADPSFYCALFTPIIFPAELNRNESAGINHRDQHISSEPDGEGFAPKIVYFYGFLWLA